MPPRAPLQQQNDSTPQFEDTQELEAVPQAADAQDPETSPQFEDTQDLEPSLTAELRKEPTPVDVDEATDVLPRIEQR